jgi:Asp-tRNA(Asn)/Glu-tRNA(Gln) amidotransferase A subunit family amidase
MIFSRFYDLFFFISLLIVVIFSSPKNHAEGFNLLEASIVDIHQAMEKGDITSTELVQQYLARVDAYDQKNTMLNAIIRLNPHALEEAQALDQEYNEKGFRSPLHGIPLVIKDNINSAGLATTAGSVAFAGFTPYSDAFQVAKLKQAGVIVLAKVNMDELAMGINGYSSLGGQTKNPYDLSRNPGGSSAGVAVSVAANFAVAGMGTDTCGSLRIPASFNNIVGFRPTKGLSSISGVVPLSSSVDVIGPMARSVQDIAILMDQVIGYDSKDPATMLVQGYQSLGFQRSLKNIDLSTLRLGRLKSYFDSSANSQVNEVITQALDKLQSYGVTVIDVDTETLDNLVKTSVSKLPSNYNIDMGAYLKENKKSGVYSAKEIVDKGLYHDFSDRAITLVGLVNPEQPPKQPTTQKPWKEILADAIERLMGDDDIDAFIYPSVKFLPTKLGQKQQGENCILSSVSGAPALSLPIGFTKSGLPIGIELLGTVMSDEQLVSVGYAIESVLQVRKPPMTTPRLIKGLAPKPIAFTTHINNVAVVDFIFDSTVNSLQYKTRYLGTQDIYAVCLHQSKEGAVIQCLSGANKKRLEGVVKMNVVHIDALRKNELYLRIYGPESLKGKIKKRVLFQK